MHKKYITVISWILIIILAVVYVICVIYDKQAWISIISLIGILATFIGLLYTYLQSKTAAENSDATKKAVEENKAEIKRLISLSDMSHLIEKIKNTQNYILMEDYHSAVILMKDVKDDLTRAYQDYGNSLKVQDIEMNSVIKDLSIDIGSLASHLIKSKKKDNPHFTLEPEKIHEHLESAREVIIKIEKIIKI